MSNLSGTPTQGEPDLGSTLGMATEVRSILSEQTDLNISELVAVNPDTLSFTITDYEGTEFIIDMRQAQ